jgi:N-acetyl-anhydromuramyl-L-alanine amidase AmpD
MGSDSLGWLQGGSAKEGTPASADFLIKPDGKIYQITRPGWYSYHSGRAIFEGLQDPDGSLNQSLIGIELECPEQRGYKITDPQYIGLAALCRELTVFHELSDPIFTTHRYVALPKGRKQDPIFFDNEVFMREHYDPSKEAALYIFPEVLP